MRQQSSRQYVGPLCESYIYTMKFAIFSPFQGLSVSNRGDSVAKLTTVVTACWFRPSLHPTDRLLHPSPKPFVSQCLWNYKPSIELLWGNIKKKTFALLNTMVIYFRYIAVIYKMIVAIPQCRDQSLIPTRSGSKRFTRSIPFQAWITVSVQI